MLLPPELKLPEPCVRPAFRQQIDLQRHRRPFRQQSGNPAGNVQYRRPGNPMMGEQQFAAAGKLLPLTAAHRATAVG